MKRIACLFFFAIASYFTYSQTFVSTKNEQGSFVVANASQVSCIYIDDKDDWLVNKAATLLQNDIEVVTGKKPVLVNDLSSASKNTIIIGTIDGSSIIKKLIAQNKIDVSSIKGKWESFQLQTVNKPLSGIENALVIAGSDKRGTAYGVF